MMDQDYEPLPEMHPDTAREAFLAWEKFRIGYNVLLLGVVLATSRWSLFGQWDFWEYLFCCALAANICFCVGPWIEGWLSFAGGDRQTIRWSLFIPASLIACVLTVVALVSWRPGGTG